MSEHADRQVHLMTLFGPDSVIGRQDRATSPQLERMATLIHYKIAYVSYTRSEFVWTLLLFDLETLKMYK